MAKKMKVRDPLGTAPEGTTKVIRDLDGVRRLYTSLGEGNWEGKEISLPDLNKPGIRKQKRKARFRTRNSFRSTKSNSSGPLEDN